MPSFRYMFGIRALAGWLVAMSGLLHEGVHVSRIYVLWWWCVSVFREGGVHVVSECAMAAWVWQPYAIPLCCSGLDRHTCSGADI